MILDKFKLEGKTAIVTGGSRGIGNAIARAFHDAGAKVVLVSATQRVMEAAREMSERGNPVYGVQGDLSGAGEVRGIFDECFKLLGKRVNILVNAAGTQYREQAVDFPAEQWQKVIALNLSAPFFLSQCAAKTMIKQGGGKIINIASMTSYFGSVLIPAYTASKGGIAQLTKALSNEWAASGIQVNAIAPGYITTELTADIKEKNPAQYREIVSRIPANRWGKPKDLQGIALFLASDAASYITGAVIPVDGGYLGK